MRKILLVLIIGLVLGCSGSNIPFVPIVPDRLSGNFTGTVSRQQYIDSDSSVSFSTKIEFKFLSDSLYYYVLPSDQTCGYGGTRYKYEKGQLVLRNEFTYADVCELRTLSVLVGKFKVTGTNSALSLYQEFPELELVRTIELVKDT